ncbi:MAG: UPF0104 family protein, partial [Sciscionella sp.]
MSEHVSSDQLTPPAKGPAEGNTAEVAERTPTWRAYALAWLRRILLLLVVLGAGYTLARNWETVARTLGRLPWEETVLSQLVVMVGIGLGTIGWSTVVDGLGPRVGIMRGAQINLVGQLGKYVPGSVWAYLLQMELGRRAGVARARVFTGSLIQAGVGLVTALVFAVAALPMLTEKFPATIYLVAVLPLALAMLHPRVLTFAVNLVLRVLRRAPLEHRLRYRLIGGVFGLQVLAYGFFGLHLWLLA